MSSLMPLLSKQDRTKNVMLDILRLIKCTHNCNPRLSNDKCNSVECFLEILCNFRNNIVFPEHLNILTNENILWHFIAQGLSHLDALTRKRANYIFKRAMDAPIAFDIDNNGNLHSLIPFMDLDNFKHQRKMWDDFFIVIETLEEKQVHLVQQVFGKISQLMSKVPKSFETLSLNKPLDINWILVIYKLLFQHQNQAIVKWSAQNFLTVFSSNYIGYHEFVTFLCTTVLNALNSTKYFTYLQDLEIKCELEILLSQFLGSYLPLKSMPDSVQTNTSFWNRFLKAVFAISWGPLPLFHITRAISVSLKNKDSNGNRYVQKRMIALF